MVHVSKRRLKKQYLERLFNQLAISVHTSSKRKTGALLRDLLTDSEQVMLAKRLAVILMLYEGHSCYRIWKTLNMSSSTVRSMWNLFEEGEYDNIIQTVCKRKDEREKYWKTLEIILRGGMPSMGKDRWQSLKTME